MSADPSSDAMSRVGYEASPLMSNRSKSRLWVAIVLSCLVGCVGSFVVVSYLPSRALFLFLETLSWYEILIALPPLMWFVVAVHEIGHLIGGVWNRARFVMLIIYPFQWLATQNGVRFELVTGIGHLGGLAITAPTAIGPRIKQQLFWMIAGGPLASLVLAVLATVPAWNFDGRMAGYFQLIAVLSCFCFLLAIVPGKVGGFMTDGMQLIELVGKSRSIVERTAVLEMMAQMMAGHRPRDWDVEPVFNAKLETSEEFARRLAAWQYLLYWAMDRDDQVRVHSYQETLESNVCHGADGFRQSIYIELVLLAALERDLEKAEAFLAGTKGGIATNRSRLELACAAVGWAKRDFEAMQRHVDAAEASMSKHPANGFDELTRDQIRTLLGKPVD